MSNPAVFLDRDGTINEEVDFPDRLSQIRVFPEVAPAIRGFNEAGLKVVVITNQSGVGRGYFPLSFVHEVHQYLNERLAGGGAHLDGLYVCPHHPDEGCPCRKPKPELLLRAARELDLDLARSYLVGDRYLDIETAANAGVKGILVLTGYGRGEYESFRGSRTAQPAHVAENLREAAEWIIEDMKMS